MATPKRCKCAKWVRNCDCATCDRVLEVGWLAFHNQKDSDTADRLREIPCKVVQPLRNRTDKELLVYIKLLI